MKGAMKNLLSLITVPVLRGIVGIRLFQKRTSSLQRALPNLLSFWTSTSLRGATQEHRSNLWNTTRYSTPDGHSTPFRHSCAGRNPLHPISVTLSLSKWSLLCLLLTLEAYAQQNPVLTDASMSGESHVIQGTDSVVFMAGFEWEAQSDADATFVAQFGYHELLADYGGALSSSSGFGISDSGVVGGTPTSFNVTPSGAGIYEIPILVSPGTNGMEPNLSIVYNSQAPDGLLGKGFSLSGLSALTRSPSTKYHDGSTDPVDFDHNDKLTLDGERLILVSGDYGQSGSEYRFENDRLAQIRATGLDDGSAHPFSNLFEVREKSGLIKTYGGTTVLTHGNGLIHTWLLHRVEDRAGNYMTYHYTITGSEAYVTEIRYTGNDGAGLAPYASVVFEYANRTKTRDSYLYGHKQELTKRLTNIRSRYGTEIIRDYSLTYHNIHDIPHLAKVTEHVGNQHYNPIQFQWNEPLGYQFTAQTRVDQFTQMTGNRITQKLTKYLPGDYTGDGKADLLAFYDLKTTYEPTGEEVPPPGAGDDAQVRGVLYEEQDGEMVQVSSWEDPDPDLKYKLPGDYDGDGTTDVLAMDPDTDEYGIWLAPALSAPVPARSGTFGDFDWLYPADFNGDGYTDLFAIKLMASDLAGYTLKVEGTVHYNYGSTWSAGLPRQWYTSIRFALTDFLITDANTDGNADIVSPMHFDGVGRSTLYHGTPVNSWTVESALEGFHISRRRMGDNFYHADFNGDGLLDVLELTDTHDFFGASLECSEYEDQYYDSGELEIICTGPPPPSVWAIHYGNGKGFEAGQPVNSAVPTTDFEVYFGDFDGDGMTDIGIHEGSTLSTYRISANHGLTLLQSLPVAQDKRITIGDFTGNGISDIAVVEVTTQEVQGNNYDCGSGGTCPDLQFSETIQLQKDYSPVPMMIKAVANSYGSRVFLDYKPLTDSQVYTKGNTADPNVLDVQFPMYVVSNVYADNGLGDLAETRYFYKELVAHRHGLGLLGFQEVIAEDLAQNLKTRQVFSHDNFHYAHLLSVVETSTLEGQQLALNTYQYKALLANSQVSNANALKYHMYAVEQEEAISYDLNSGSKLTHLSTVNDYGDYANILEIQQDYVGEQVSVQTVNTYGHVDLSSWELGKVLTTHVTTTVSALPSTRTVDYAYDHNLFLEKEELQKGHPLALRTNYSYDAYGNMLVTTVTGKSDLQGNDQSRIVAVEYDNKGRFVKKEINGLSHEVNRTFDHRYGNPLTESDPNGLTTHYTYDSFGRLSSVTTPFGEVATTTYGWDNGAGNARYYVRVNHSTQGVSTTYYDRLNREVRSVSPSFSGTVTVDQKYSSRGQLAQSSLPYSGGETQWITHSYDAIGRPNKVADAAGRITTNDYNGLETVSTDARNKITKTLVNQLGQTILSTDGDNNTLGFTYHPNGEIATVTDPGGNVTAFTYDNVGNNIRVDDPDLGVISKVYNAFGEVLEQTDEAGVTTRFQYDVLGRITERVIAGETTTWTFDHTSNLGAVRAITNTNGISKTYNYDNLFRLQGIEEEFGQQTYRTEVSYQDNRLNQITYPGGFAVKYAYTNGFLASVKSVAGDTTYWQATSHNQLGQVTSYTMHNGAMQTDRFFNLKTGTLESINTTKGSVDLQVESYKYDNLSNLTTRIDHLADGGTGLTERFTYDNLNRLTNASIVGKNYGQLTVVYDALGNITSKSDVGTYAYNGSGGPHAISSLTLNSGVNVPTATQDITYTGYDKVAQISEARGILSNATIGFSYGVDHERKVTVTTLGDSTITKRFVGDLYEEEIVEVGSSIVSTTRQHYVFGGEGAVAIYTTKTEGSATGSSLHYLIKDHLGSICAITDTQGNILEKYSFDAWGKRRDSNNWDTYLGTAEMQDRGYTGHEHLGIFSLINMNGRVYDPVLGRMLSADTYTPYNDHQTQSLNRYAYAFNNPLSYSDPSGHIPIPLITAIPLILKAVTVTATAITAAAVVTTVVAATAVTAATVYGFTAVSGSSAISSALASSGQVGLSQPHFEFTKFNNGNLEIVGNNFGTSLPSQPSPYPLPPNVSSIGASPLPTAAPQLPSSVATIANPMQAAASGPVAASGGWFKAASDIAYEINKFNPLAIAVNSVKALFTGTDTYGTPTSAADATFNLATIAPIFKFGQVGRSAFNLFRASNRAAKGSGNAFRYVTQGEINAIKNTGLLRGGRPGETFFTKDVFRSGARAQQRLALPTRPTHRIEFSIRNNPHLLRNGTKVRPAFGQSGRGAEFLTTDPVRVNIFNIQPLR